MDELTPVGGRARAIVNALRWWSRLAVAAVCVLLVSAVPGATQTNTAEIAGVVRDQSSGVLPGAVVVATHPASGLTVERVSDVDGRFFMSSLPIGEWEIAVEMSGFRRVMQRGVLLVLGQSIELEFDMRLGQLSEEITVTTDASVLQTTTAEISDVIENRAVQQIPLNGRQFLQLAQLSDAASSRRGAPEVPPFSRLGHSQTSVGSAPDTTSTCSTDSR